MNWKTVSQFQAGGLGVHSLVQFNSALLGKWLWHSALARESLWSRVIAIKYGCDKGDWVSGMRYAHRSSECLYGNIYQVGGSDSLIPFK